MSLLFTGCPSLSIFFAAACFCSAFRIVSATIKSISSLGNEQKKIKATSPFREYIRRPHVFFKSRRVYFTEIAGPNAFFFFRGIATFTLTVARFLGKDLWTSSLSQKAKLLSLVAAECGDTHECCCCLQAASPCQFFSPLPAFVQHFE